VSILRRLFRRSQPEPVQSQLPLSFSEYRDVVADLPRPTAEHTEAFSRFVSHAHSWYKHLPLPPPGGPLLFFLDPGAGMQREVTREGRVRVTSREETGFHHSWVPTQQYRERFGHLAFSRSAGTSVALVGPERQLVPSDDDPVIYSPRKQCLAQLPPEVLAAGRTDVSGIVHTLAAAHPDIWLGFESSGDLENWPEESGGRAGIGRILDRCRELSEDSSREEQLDVSDPRAQENYYLPFVDYPLHQLLEPERVRQLQGMVVAMQRVCDLVTEK
jgi:hypothetical protein